MQSPTIKLYSLPFSNAKTYVAASLFIIGNILLPQLFHLVNMGGPTWLPIYFFTLIGAFKYGWRVGLLTAVASPIINSTMFGMPSAAMLPVVLLKSCVLASAAGFMAHRFKRSSLLILASIVAFYQAIGFIGEWIILEDLNTAVISLHTAIPGMLLQIFGGWLILRK